MKTVWVEDDCTVSDPYHEGPNMAYKRIVGEVFDAKQAVSREDQGDGILYCMPNGMRVWMSYPGGSVIYLEAT